MKKIGLLCLALVLALGTLGVAYSSWHDVINVSGSVDTGTVCIEFVPWANVGGVDVYVIEESPGPPGLDLNWTHWVSASSGVSCPPGGQFDGIHLTEPAKDVGHLGTVTPVFTNGFCKELQIDIDNAYPYFYIYITYLVDNCGTIPVNLKTPVIGQDDSLRIVYFDGDQIEPDSPPHEVSLAIGVTQYQDPNGDGDNPELGLPLTPQNTPLSFTITLEGEQWYDAP
jgi:hypothetical protein